VGKEFYFETDDRLDRKKYAEFIKTLIENCDDYRREDSDGAYVIAIDSPWGTGKTRFAKMLRNHLEDRSPEMGADSDPGENASFNTIYYNSWDTDFSNDALQPLIHTITKSPEFKPDEFGEAGEEILEKFKKSAIAVAKVAGFALVHHFFGETATEVVKALDEASSEVKADPLEEYQSRLDLLQGFKDSLRDLIAQTKRKKLVIIVDELDRCRPTYAIQTLEIVKHLFDVDGLVFIFALDIKQLSSSVKTVYGQEMDATGYLCRFFDYIGKITIPDEKSFIAQFIANGSCFKKYPFQNIELKVVDFIYIISSIYKLSLRDISTLIQNYMLMHESFLHAYQLIEAHMLYISLLIIKYKDMDFYNKLRKARNVDRLRLGDVFYSDEQKEILNNCESLGYAISGTSIMDMDYDLIIWGKLETRRKLKIINADTKLIDSHLKVSYEFDTSEGRAQKIFNLDVGGSLNNILFIPDLLKWDRIKQLTPMEYFYCQLEMFNFAFPADETTPEA
jgi:hypothetical protein